MRRTLACAGFLIGIVLPGRVLAQGETAEPVRGRFRLTVGADWLHWSDRYGSATPFDSTFAEGTREPLGKYFGGDSLGTARLPFLAPTQSTLRQITGLSGYLVTIGRMRLTMDASWRSMPLRLEFAPSSRLGFSAMVPLVRARVSTFLTGPDTGAAGALTRGNVGLNTAIATPGALDTYRSQAEAAMIALQTQAASGPASLRPQAAAQLAALQPFVCALYSLAGGSSTTASSPCFSATTIQRSPILPLTGSAIADSIAAILTRDQSSYSTLATQYAAQGVTLPPFNSAFVLPSVALDSAGIRRLFYDPGGAAADSLNEVVRTRLGDIELGAWYQLANTAKWRSQLAMTVRLPTGYVDSPDNFIDLSTGDHQLDVEVAMRNDFVAGNNLWFYVGGRYGVQMADKLTRRVTPWYLPFAPTSSDAEVNRKLGNYFGLDLVPNWKLDESFGVGIGWHYFHQAATTFTYVDPADETRIGLPASVLGEATSVTWMRVGVGVTFSTVDRFMHGRAKLPYRVTWSYNSTFYGRGGQVPKAGVMQLMISAYFGGLHN